jgi:hypothetical protein
MNEAAPGGKPSALRSINWIWTVRGSLMLGSGQSGDDAFARLDALFREPGTTRRREGTVLIFDKVNPLSQDKLAVFDRGELQVVAGPSGNALCYDLHSRALLFCFLAPFFFLGVSAAIETSRISGRVFAGIFAVLYIAGRLLEARLVARLFARCVTERARSGGL